MAHIFISYSRTDEAFARQLATSLSQLGADVWIDIEDIPSGMKWSRAIQEGLDVSNVLLVVISPESMASHNVEDEWQYYLDQKKPVIPLLYRPAKLHFQLSRMQYIDFNRNPYDKAFRQLHRELGRKGVQLNPLAPRNTSTQPIVRMQTPSTVAQSQPERRLPITWLAMGAVLLVVGVGLGVFLSNPNRTAGVTEQPTTQVIPTSAPDDKSQQQLPTTDPYAQSQSQANASGGLTYDDDKIRFSYPEGWQTDRVSDQGSASVVFVANNSNSISAMKDSRVDAIQSIQAGQIAVAVLTDAEKAIPEIYNMTSGDALITFKHQLLNSYPDIVFGDITSGQVNAGLYYYVVGADSHSHSIAIGVIDPDAPNAGLVLIFGAAGNDQVEAFVRAVEMIANSLQIQT